MKDFLETTLGRVLLGVVVATIWGVNAINFSEMRTGSSAQVAQQVERIDLDELTVPEEISYRYTASRDPFVSNMTRENQSQPVQAPENEQMSAEDPELALMGVFDGMAVITDGQGQSYFVQEGQRFNLDILVQGIAQDSVILQYQQRTLILKLN